MAWHLLHDTSSCLELVCQHYLQQGQAGRIVVDILMVTSSRGAAHSKGLLIGLTTFAQAVAADEGGAQGQCTVAAGLSERQR